MSKLIDAIQRDTVTGKYTLTENGALALKSSGSAVLDFFSKAAAMRKQDTKKVIKLFETALKENEIFAITALFYIRDIRGGQGERKIFRECLSYLANKRPKVISYLLPFISEYGRYDDLFALENTSSYSAALSWLSNTLIVDVNSYRNTPVENLHTLSISLCSKWMPSEFSGKRAKQRAYQLANYMGLSMRDYRKMLSILRNHLRIVETKMCKKDWSEIDYSQVPSKASFMYRKAFMKHDATRYKKYLESVKNGKAKINAKTLYPYEIVKSIIDSNFRYDITLEQLWNNLPDYVNEEHSNAIAVVDTSGSMHGTPISVSIALGMYLAQRQSPESLWYNHFITFETNPHLIEIKGENVAEQVKNVYRSPWGGNTDLEAVFYLILDTAKKNRLKSEDLPQTLYIISDMEFNSACNLYTRGKKTILESITAKYKVAGYSRPKIVFWNVDCRNEQSPAAFDEYGVALFSGLSPTIFKATLTGTFNPLSIMVDTLTSDRYKPLVDTLIEALV